MYQFPEHTPYMMPYNMEYPMHSLGGSEIGTSDMYHQAALQLASAGHAGIEGLTAAESSFHHNIADTQNNTQMLAALNAAGLGHKVKRQDAWIGKSKFVYKRKFMFKVFQSV